MNAVRASDLRRVLKLERATLQRLDQRVDFFQQNVGRITQQQRVSRVDNVRRRQAIVNEATCFTDRLRKVRSKRDDVVISRLFDLVDALQPKTARAL